MAYADLTSFSVQVQLWITGSWTYNRYHAETEMTLADILNREPQAQIELTRSFVAEGPNKTKNRTVDYPVHKLWVKISISSQRQIYFSRLL